MSAVPAFRRPAPPEFLRASSNPPLDAELDHFGEDAALRLFRSGMDTKDIAWRLECTQAAAANGLAKASERSRA